MKNYNLMFGFLLVIMLVGIILLHKDYIQLQMHTHQNVQIQILGNHQNDKRTQDDEEYDFLLDEINDDKKSMCAKGDQLCEKNVDFFGKTYLIGMLNENNMNIMSVAEENERNQAM